MSFRYVTNCNAPAFVLHAGMYKKTLQDPIDLRQEAEAIYSAFELSLCRDVVFEASVVQYWYT